MILSSKDWARLAAVEDLGKLQVYPGRRIQYRTMRLTRSSCSAAGWKSNHFYRELDVCAYCYYASTVTGAMTDTPTSGTVLVHVHAPRRADARITAFRVTSDVTYHNG
jgi:hypothetical protein